MKIAAVVLIVICGCLIGTELKNKLSERVKIISEYRSNCSKLMNMIRFERLPLDRLFLKLNNTDSDIFSLCALYINEGMDFHSAWESAIKGSDEIRYLKESERDAIVDLGAQLGRSDAQGELSIISRIDEKLQEAYEDAVCDLRSKGRVYSVCGLLGGMMCALIMI